MVQEHIWEEILGYPSTQPGVLIELMATHLKFDNFVVREMAGSASPLPAI